MALNQGPNLGTPLPGIGEGLSGESVEAVNIPNPQPGAPSTTGALDSPEPGPGFTVSESASKADMTQILENKTFPKPDEPAAVSALETLPASISAADIYANYQKKFGQQ